MTEAVIVSTACTGLAKSWKDAPNMTRGATLDGHVVQYTIECAKIEPGEMEGILMGCADPEGTAGTNIARRIAPRVGCSVMASGVIASRFYSSGLRTIAMAA